MNDELLEELLLLEADLTQRKIRLILGGGMSLFLRNRYVRPKATQRYPIQIESRSTNDIDFYFTSDLIADSKAAEGVKACLKTLGYEVSPDAKNFQFVKVVKTKMGPRTFKVDLLSQPPFEKDASLVEVKSPRIKPRGVTGIHAYLTEEALGIDIGLIKVDMQSIVPTAAKAAGTIYLPSSYNYIIMKLHAFDDRKDRGDEKSDYGRHHALDIFATVSRMNEEDWSVAKDHFDKHHCHDYIKNSVKIRENCFSKPSGIGLIRIQENEGFRRNREEFEPYLEQFIEDMEELFPTRQKKSNQAT